VFIFYAKHEHGTGIAGVSQFLFRNVTSALICLYPCYIKKSGLDGLHVFCALVELRLPIAPEPAPEKKNSHRYEKIREAGLVNREVLRYKIYKNTITKRKIDGAFCCIVYME
jgi:hypothetical protein